MKFPLSNSSRAFLVLLSNSKSSFSFSFMELVFLRTIASSSWNTRNCSPAWKEFLICAGITICPFELRVVVAICMVR